MTAPALALPFLCFSPNSDSPSAISSAQKALDGRKTNSISQLIADRLSQILGVDSETIFKKTQKTRRLDETVIRNADEDTASKIRSLIIEERLEHLVFLEADLREHNEHVVIKVKTVNNGSINIYPFECEKGIFDI